MGIAKQATEWAAHNLRYARAVARTPAGASFLRWGMVGAGAGAVYGMADNLTGNDRVSVVQGAVRGGMIGMGARGLFGGFLGLRPKKLNFGSRTPAMLGTPGNPININNVRRMRQPLSLGSSQMGAGFTMRPGGGGFTGGGGAAAASALRISGASSVPLLTSQPNFTMVNASRGRRAASMLNPDAIKLRYNRRSFGVGKTFYGR